MGYKRSPAVIFDIDGTLANCNHRRHFVEGKKKDFDSFYNAMADDTVNENIKNICNLLWSNGFHIIICTGRPEEYRFITQKWLADNGIDYVELLMRPDERRHNPDYEVKRDMLGEILDVREVLMAFDDRDQVVKMWRANGIQCLQVAEGNF